MKLADMLPDTPYKITKDNSDKSLVVGDIISVDDDGINIWDGNDSGSFTPDDLKISSIVDFECEDASDECEIVVTKWSKEFFRR